MSLTNQLNCRISVFEEKYLKSDLGDIKKSAQFVKKIWAGLCPIKSNASDIKELGSIEQLNILHIITIRKNVVKKLSEDMFFVYNNYTYHIKSWRPHYKYNDRIEIICSMSPAEGDFYE